MRTLAVFMTAPSEETAAHIARSLVENRLAACVQVLPGIISFYRWEGKIEEAPEWLILAKTTAERFDELKAKVESAHPYEVPEIVAVEIASGAQKYLKWIEEETRR